MGGVCDEPALQRQGTRQRRPGAGGHRPAWAAQRQRDAWGRVARVIYLGHDLGHELVRRPPLGLRSTAATVNADASSCSRVNTRSGDVASTGAPNERAQPGQQLGQVRRVP